MRYLVLFLLTTLLSISATAQEKYTISGYVKDKESGEVLIGANVYLPSTGRGTSTNVYGFYSITLPAGKQELAFSFVGYQTEKLGFELTEYLELNINLVNTITLGEAEITADKVENIEQRTQMSTITISTKQIERLPVLLGEKDVLKTIQLLPGVQSGSEGSSGIYVRGGGPDQNLILLDGVPLYNVSHLFGFFSVFNAEAINNITLIKGGFPARYGGRLSSVLDIRMKDGNMEETEGDISIGLIAAKFSVQGPIKKGTTSYMVSGRRTFLDALSYPFQASNAAENGWGGYFFYDFNAKVNHIIDNKNRIYASGYYGNDKFFYRYTDRFGDNEEKIRGRLAWGNALGTVRWNHTFSPKLFGNFTGSYTRYQFKTGVEIKTTEGGNDVLDLSQQYTSSIRDYALRADFDFLPSLAHSIKFGGGSIFHTFKPGVNTFKGELAEEFDFDSETGSDPVSALETYFYAEDDWKISDRLNANGGLHLSSFIAEGKFYANLEPRISSRLLLNEKIALKGSYSRMVQYLHLLSNVGIGLPTDLWVPVTDQIEPQISDQVALGFATTLKNEFQLSIEGYYKKMDNLIDYKEGTNFTSNAEDWQTKVEKGQGWSYGGEFLIEKKAGDFTGWIGYTLSWTERQFENLNKGEKYPYRYDRRHDIGIALSYQINENVDVGAVWVYGTGNAITIATARYQGAQIAPSVPFGGFFGQEVEHIESRNGFRMPSYHRLDLGVNFNKEMKRGTRTWSFGIYNVYNRQNPFFLFFDQDIGNTRSLKQISIFPIIPSFSYKYHFN